MDTLFMFAMVVTVCGGVVDPPEATTAPPDTATDQPCDPTEFACADGSKSILFELKCNGNTDCADGSDEDDCSVICTDTQFKCSDGSLCIDEVLTCNTEFDCNDQSDEHDCPTTTMMPTTVQPTVKATTPTATTTTKAPPTPTTIPPTTTITPTTTPATTAQPTTTTATAAPPTTKAPTTTAATTAPPTATPTTPTTTMTPTTTTAPPPTTTTATTAAPDTSCLPEEYSCQDGTFCIDLSLVCDGANDCDDNSDEANGLCSLSRTGYTEAQKELVLQQHNFYRLAESATDMMRLRWNVSLAASAQTASNLCIWEHSNLNGIGENMAAGSINQWFPNWETRAPVDNWAAEKKNYKIGDNTCTSVCGHFTQVVWAKTTSVGCGVTKCGNIGNISWENGGYVVICQYHPGGNYYNQYPYSEGSNLDDRCDACPDETSCFRKMCQEGDE